MNAVRHLAMKYSKLIASKTSELARFTEGYYMFIIIVLVSAALVVLIQVGTEYWVPKELDLINNAKPVSHRSNDWYANHSFSDGRKIPLNKGVSGIFIEKIYDLNLEKSSVKVKGELWTKWIGDLKDWNGKKENRHPHLTLAMSTLNESSNIYRKDIPTYHSSHGWKHVTTQFDAEFDADMNFTKYPFDRQRLTIRALGFHGDAAWMRTYIDKDSVLSGTGNRMKEYNIDDIEFRDLVYEYPTRFGLTDYDENEKQNYSVSGIEAMITVSRSVVTGMWREIMPPLLVSMLLLINTITPITEQWEHPKAAIPAAVFLTLVILHQGSQSRLPPLNYVTFMDIYYTLLYTASIVFAIEVIVTSRHSSGLSRKMSRRITQLIYLFFGSYCAADFLGITIVVYS